MRAAKGQFQLDAGWLPPDFTAGAGRIQYSVSPFVDEDGSSEPPGSVTRLTIGADAAEPQPLTVLFNLRFMGPNIGSQWLRVLAIPAEPGRLASYRPPHWYWQRTGVREVLRPSVPADFAAPPGLWQVLWEEQNAELSVTGQGVHEADLLKFVASLCERTPGATDRAAV